MSVKVLRVCVTMICLTMLSPESLCDTDLFHQALSNFSAKKHLAEFQVLTSASPESPRAQDSGPSTTESKPALFRLYFFTMQRKRLKWLCFYKNIAFSIGNLPGIPIKPFGL